MFSTIFYAIILTGGVISGLGVLAEMIVYVVQEYKRLNEYGDCDFFDEEDELK